MSIQKERETAAHRRGWRPEEIRLLEAYLAKGQAGEITLREVFDAVAQATGRKPNSVRNYYYTVLCRQAPEEGGQVARFTPFTPEEMEKLLRDLLCAQADGQSVRACALEMAEGDRAKMLRFQNKYRSLVRSHPELVHAVMEALAQEQRTYYNPYDRNIHRPRSGEAQVVPAAGRSRSPKGLLQEAMHDLEVLYHVDAMALANGLKMLSRMANRGQAAQDALEKTLRRAESLQLQLERLYEAASQVVEHQDPKALDTLRKALQEVPDEVTHRQYLN